MSTAERQGADHGASAGKPAKPALLDRFRPEHMALLIVLIGSAVLEVHGISHNGYGNAYYSAAVLSMLRSLHNFIFASSDPGGLISVDKPPLGLWLQVFSAKLLGFKPLSLLLPQAACGWLAVLVSYRVIAPRFGRWAGVAAAATLAVFPAFVASTRDNNLDALLILLMLLACWAMLRAIETDRLWTLLLSAVLVGLAFNTKALAAYLVVPGMAVAYLACAEGALRRRIARLLAAGVVLAVVSLAWIVAVDLVPASQRPYVGGTQNDSEVSLTLGYNGLGRVTGENGGPGETPFVPRAFPTPPRHVATATTGSTAATGSSVPEVNTPVAPPVQPVHHYLTGNAHRATEAIALGPSPGPFRLLGIGFGDQAGWLLPFAAFGMLALVLLAWRRVARGDRRVAVLLVLGGWLATEVVVLSFSGGIVHPYYTSALGPGVAAMVAAGAVAFIELARRDRRYLALPALALVCTLLVQLGLLHREYNYLELLWPLLGIVVIGAVATLWLAPARAATAIVVGLVAMLFVPAVYSATVWEVPVDGTFPAAGPYVDAGRAASDSPSRTSSWTPSCSATSSRGHGTPAGRCSPSRR